VIVAVKRDKAARTSIDGAQTGSAKKLRKEIGVKLNSPSMKMIFRKRAKRSSTGIKARVSPTLRDFPGRADRRKRGRRGSFTRSTKVRGAVKRIRLIGNEHFSERFSQADENSRQDDGRIHRQIQAIGRGPTATGPRRDQRVLPNHGYIDAEVQETAERKNGRFLSLLESRRGRSITSNNSPSPVTRNDRGEIRKSPK